MPTSRQPNALHSAAIKLALSFSGMPLSVLLLRWTHWDGFFVTFLIALVLSVLYGLNLGQQIRAIRPQRWPLRLLGLLLGGPQALLGLGCIAAGAAIVIWVLYNSFVERLPSYSGTFLSLGIGPVLIWVGYRWLMGAFSAGPPPPNECLAVTFDDQQIHIRVLAHLEPGWNATVAWQDITRVCFKDEGMLRSDLLFLTVRGREQVVPVLTEAEGAMSLLAALNERGLFPLDVWRKAVGDTSGGMHCWPPH